MYNNNNNNNKVGASELLRLPIALHSSCDWLHFYTDLQCYLKIPYHRFVLQLLRKTFLAKDDIINYFYALIALTLPSAES